MMKKRFHYFRDEGNRPVVTICTLSTEEGDTVAAGIAICSPRDNPNKKVGRRIASQRAFHALNHIACESSLPIKRLEAKQILYTKILSDTMTGCVFTERAMFNRKRIQIIMNGYFLRYKAYYFRQEV
jgi:hypothetical protein